MNDNKALCLPKNRMRAQEPSYLAIHYWILLDMWWMPPPIGYITGRLPAYCCRPTAAGLLLPAYCCRLTAAGLLLPAYCCGLLLSAYAGMNLRSIFWEYLLMCSRLQKWQKVLTVITIIVATNSRKDLSTIYSGVLKHFLAQTDSSLLMN